MKKINKKIAFEFILIGILLIMLLSSVSAVAFSSNTNSNPLLVYPGEEKTDAVVISPSSAEEKVARVVMEDNAGIATITDSGSDYTLVSGQNTPIHLKLSVPANAAVGTEYVVKIRAIDVTGGAGGGGTVGLTSASLISFYLKVVEKPAPVVTPAPEVPAPTPSEGISPIWWILGIIVIIAIIAIIWFVVKSRKE